jgi:serine/threonine protein kinase
MADSFLERFRLDGLLGEGAELQVFAATDLETSRAVVVKRPHPALIGRLQHRDIERRLARVAELRRELADSLPHLSRLIEYVPPQPNDAYFGDSLEQSYAVIVEERARGLPLVGSALDGVKGIPIGLPQNLFVLHPLLAHAQKGGFTILRDLIEVVDAFYKRGHLLLDVRPQNVFFDPRDASITVIDVSSIAAERAATRRRAALDLHDFYLEIFKWYLTPNLPPENAAAYGKPYGMKSVAAFADLDGLLSEFSAMDQEPIRTLAMGIIQKVRKRGYRTLDEFSQDFGQYLALAQERYARLRESVPLVEAWMSARCNLSAPYWRKFLFDPDVDMVPYDV